MKFKLKGFKAPSLPKNPFKNLGQKIKARRAAEREQVPTMLRVLTFLITLISMLLGLSMMPLFPQPLPAVIAFLIAFIAYENPLFSMPVGGALVGLGAIYNLSKMNFVAMLGDEIVRQAVIFVFLFVFTALPIIFHKQKSAIAINLGIIAAVMLFFNQTYFLAIPLIFASIMIFKKQSFLTVAYYGLISVPLEMMQYLAFIETIPKPDWWVEPGSFPPVFVPLSGIFKNLQESMTQFRLYDTSKIVYTITDQISMTPPAADHTVGEVLSHYLDSLPGIFLFLVIVAVLVSAFVLLTRTFLARSHVGHGEKILPTITATVATMLFFILVGALSGPLAFEAKVGATQIIIGTFVAAIFTLPALFIDQTPKRRATVEMLAEKAQGLMTRVQAFESLLGSVKGSISVDVSSTEGKMLILKDRLNDTLTKASDRYYDFSEIDEKFNELDTIEKEIGSLQSELDTALRQYQIFVTGEYASWVGKFRDIGVEPKVAAKLDFQKDQPIEERIQSIKEVIDAGKTMITETIPVAEEVYGIVRSLYDPSLPEISQAATFARAKLNEKAEPWEGLEGLFVALSNWKKQYQSDISQSVENLQISLSSIANLKEKHELLRSVFGDKFPGLLNAVKMAEEARLTSETDATKIISVTIINKVLESSTSITREILSILGEELASKQQSIESLLPTEDFQWEENAALNDRLTSFLEVLSNPSKYGLNQALETLPKAVSYIDEGISTAARYTEQEEVLLNYPMAEIAIEGLLKQKMHVSAKDLPFDQRYAEEYMRMFHSKKFREVSFDTAKLVLSAKPEADLESSERSSLNKRIFE